MAGELNLGIVATNNLGSLKSIRENAQKIKDGLSQMTEAVNAILISASEKRD